MAKHAKAAPLPKAKVTPLVTTRTPTEQDASASLAARSRTIPAGNGAPLSGK